MMKNILFVFFSLIGSLFLLANRNGRAANSGLGSTGAPGDDATVCQSCHNGPIDVKVDITVLDNLDTVKTYIPEKEYTVRVNISHIGGNVPKAYGFQLVALKAALKQNGTDLKNWFQVPSTAKLTTARNGRQYVEHKDRTSSNVFDIKWKSPTSGTGPISFYAGGNGVNSDNSSSGDGSARTSLQINENIESYTLEKNKIDISITPNPIQDRMILHGDITKIASIQFYTIFGQAISYFTINNDKTELNVEFLKDGIYLVQCKDKAGKVLKTIKVLKRKIMA